ncbi:hypothetical protein [Brachybacterium sp. Z12]|uniref:hypothetical protein n=1 Tax=Brachybacterium sp. Z12 TaxID=2759167 RepID=UPI00223B9DB8|nr:hypothetical protein [Brachybacterium sp. Z12]
MGPGRTAAHRERARGRRRPARELARPGPRRAPHLGALEDRNLLDLARLLVAHALERPESVGAHHRLDDPSTPAVPHPDRTLMLTPEAPAC